jgi:hypothetical protein
MDQQIGLSDLPFELISHVCTFLPLDARQRFSATNRELHDAVYTAAHLWKCIDYDETLRGAIKRTARDPIRVDLERVTDDTFLALMDRISPAGRRKIQYLRLDFTSIGPKSVAKVLQQCDNLRELSLYGTLNATCKFAELYNSLKLYVNNATRTIPLRINGLFFWHPDILQGRFWQHEISGEKEMDLGGSFQVLAVEPTCEAKDCANIAPCLFPSNDFEPSCHNGGSRILTEGRCLMCTRHQRLCPDHLQGSRCCMCWKNMPCQPCQVQSEVKVYRCRCDGTVCHDCSMDARRSRKCTICDFVACIGCSRIEFGDSEFGTCQSCFIGGYVW